jgi:hypothetical protein
VYYTIAKPEKAIPGLGTEKEIAYTLKETCIAMLQSIIRSTRFADMAQSRVVNAGSEIMQRMQVNPFEPPSITTIPVREEKAVPEEKAQAFCEHVHDSFILKLHSSFYDEFGVDVTNIRLERVQPTNAALITMMSEQATVTWLLLSSAPAFFLSLLNFFCET